MDNEQTQGAIGASSIDISSIIQRQNEILGKMSGDFANFRDDLSAAVSSVSALSSSVSALNSRVASIESIAIQPVDPEEKELVRAHYSALVERVDCLEKRIEHAFDRLKHHGIEGIDSEPEPEPQPEGEKVEQPAPGSE